jgi:hypothetical protein
MIGQLGIDGLRRKVNGLEEELGKLGNSVERNRNGDILMFARIRDELDAISNSKKEDRIVVTGLTNSVPMPQSIDGKRKWLNNMVGGILDGIVPGSSANIQFIDLGKKHKGNTTCGGEDENKGSGCSNKTPVCGKKESGV